MKGLGEYFLMTFEMHAIKLKSLKLQKDGKLHHVVLSQETKRLPLSMKITRNSF